jgi:broad specificity phosphatase PhoE
MDLQNLNLNLFLIRHAQPHNLPNHWTAPSSPLSEQGILQAGKLAQELEKQVFNRIISSPFVRTVETAEIIQQKLSRKIPIEKQEWLAEIDLGRWAGNNKSGILADPSYPKSFPTDKAVDQEPLVARLMNTNKSFSFPDGEDLASFWNRVQEGFNNLINKYRNNNQQFIGLVGHGGSFSIISSILLGRSFSDEYFPIIAIKMANYAHIRIHRERVVFLGLTNFSYS